MQLPCLSSLSADTYSCDHSVFQPLVLGPRRRAQKTREVAEGAGAPPTGTRKHTLIALLLGTLS